MKLTLVHRYLRRVCYCNEEGRAIPEGCVVCSVVAVALTHPFCRTVQGYGLWEREGDEKDGTRFRYQLEDAIQGLPHQTCQDQSPRTQSRRRKIEVEAWLSCLDRVSVTSVYGTQRTDNVDFYREEMESFFRPALDGIVAEVRTQFQKATSHISVRPLLGLMCVSL